MLKFRFKKYKTNYLVKTAEILGNVNQLIEMKLLTIEKGKVKMYQVLFGSKSNEEKVNIIKNIYLYCCVKQLHEYGEPLIFEDIETGEVLGKYEEKKAIVLC